jgi:C-terminal peptidase prc
VHTHPSWMKRVSALVALAWLTTTAFAGAATQPADPTQGVRALLDRVEQAWDQRDVEALRACYADEGYLAIVAPPGREEGALVATKDRALAMITDTWKKNPPTAHRFTQRDIYARGDFAWLRLAIADRFEGQPDRTTRVAALAVRRGETWQMCFAMPLLVRPVVLVAEVLPGSTGERVGIKAGDVVVAYAGQDIAWTNDLQRLVESRAGDPPDQKLTLVVRRGADQNRYDVSPEQLGLRCEDRLLPAESAVLVDAGQPHPIKDVMQEELAALKASDVDRFLAIVCPTGFFGLKPEESKPTRVLGREGLRDVVTEGLAQLRETTDRSTSKYEDMRVIVDGDVAVAACRFTLDPLDKTKQKISTPSNLEVYVRQSGKWWLAASLPGPMEIGTQLRAVAVLSPEQTAEIEQRRRGEFVGVGVQIEAKPDGLLINKVFADSGAARAGLKAKDIITAIEGQSAAGMSTDEAIKLMRGPDGSTVNVTVRSAAGTEQTVAITRGTIVVSGVEHRMLADKIGFLQVGSFNERTVDEARRAIEKLTKEQARGLVLDLRGNTGGLYDEMIKFAELFIPSGQTLWFERPKSGPVTAVTARKEPATNLPLVVLIDPKSGGGELVAAAVQQCKRGTLIGQKTSGLTAGKDMVKRPDGSSELVVKTDYLMTRQKPITGQGVEPDVTVPPDATPDQVKQKAITLLKAKLKKP